VPRKKQLVQDQAQFKLEDSLIMRNDKQNSELSTDPIKINKIITAANLVPVWIINWASIVLEAQKLVPTDQVVGHLLKVTISRVRRKSQGKRAQPVSIPHHHVKEEVEVSQQD
jgi:hypothetical protein